MHSPAWMVLTVEHEDDVLVPISMEPGPWPVMSAGSDAKPSAYTHACADGPRIRARQRATESALLSPVISAVGELMEINCSAVQLLLPTGEL